MYAIRITDAPWNVIMDGATDNTAALAAISAHIASLYAAGAPLPRVEFPEGVCLFSQWPDFAFPRFEIVGTPATTLRCTGNGIAVDLDGVVRPYFVRDMTFGPFIIECGPNAGSALRVNHVHSSRIIANVRGAGVNSAAVNCAFNVCSEFWVRVSVNDWPAGWYLNGKPKRGLDIDWSGSGNPAERPTGCVFHNPIIEGLDRGIYIGHADRAIIRDGTAEACWDWGVFLDTDSAECRIENLHCEANGASGGGDVFVQGYRHFIDMPKATTLIKFYGSSDCRMLNPLCPNVVIDASAVGTKIWP